MDGKELASHLRYIADLVEGLSWNRLDVEITQDVPVLAAMNYPQAHWTAIDFPLDKNAYWHIDIKVSPEQSNTTKLDNA